MNLRFEEVSLRPAHGLAVRATVPVDELPRFFGAAFQELMQAVRVAGSQFAGPPLARYHGQPPLLEVEAIIPVTTAVGSQGRVEPITLSGGRAVQVRHVGAYDTLSQAYETLRQWMEAHQVRPTEEPREVYLSDPNVVSDPGRLETLIVQPIAPREYDAS